MNLVSVYDEPRAIHVLYELLAERPVGNWISHERMPTLQEHAAFVKERPFFHWYLIEVDGALVGALECTDLNEIGVSIFKRYQRKGYATLAVNRFVQTHKPLPAIPARRNGRWLANIACGNISSKLFFARLGFKALQETWVLQ